jgi:hypothetical protein
MAFGAFLKGGLRDWQDLPFVLIYVPFAYAGAILFGIPLHLVFERRGWMSTALYAAAGGLVALIVAACVFVLMGTGAPFVLMEWLPVAAAGVISGLSFRALARRP